MSKIQPKIIKQISKDRVQTKLNHRQCVRMWMGSSTRRCELMIIIGHAMCCVCVHGNYVKRTTGNAMHTEIKCYRYTRSYCYMCYLCNTDTAAATTATTRTKGSLYCNNRWVENFLLLLFSFFALLCFEVHINYNYYYNK